MSQVSDSQAAWAELRSLRTRDVARRLGVPLPLLRKIPAEDAAYPAMTEYLALLREVLQTKPRCARFLRHARVIRLDLVDLMHRIDCGDAHLWTWLGEEPPAVIRACADQLVDIHDRLKREGRSWQNGMVRSAATLAATCERMMAAPFPEPPFRDEPRHIEAIRTGAELSKWALEQRNCAGSYASACASGTAVVYRMLRPAPGTILVSTASNEKPWIIDARGHANGALGREQRTVLRVWCDMNGIGYEDWLAGRAG